MPVFPFWYLTFRLKCRMHLCLMFVVPYILVTCFIQIQLDVQYSFFLKSFLLYMFRMSRGLKLTVLKWQSVPTRVPAPRNKHTKTIKKPMAVHYSGSHDDGCMWHPKHIEQKNFSRKKNIVHPVGFEQSICVLSTPVTSLKYFIRFYLIILTFGKACPSPRNEGIHGA
jgi:hypothetical protein